MARDICNAAVSAWMGAGPRARRVRFAWRGRRYVSRLTNLRMLVDDDKGRPVCCRWGHDFEMLPPLVCGAGSVQ